MSQGKVSLQVPVELTAGLKLQTDGKKFSGELTVGASVRPKIVLSFVPLAYAKLGGSQWDYELFDPLTYEFADIFEDHWVIWNGCYSYGICNLADNILPTQCTYACLSPADNTYRNIVSCLSRSGGGAYDRDDVCRAIYGPTWRPYDPDAPVPPPGR